MSWHSFPHIPLPGDRIIAQFRGCEKGNYFEIKVREGEKLEHISRWCYWEDYYESVTRKLQKEK